MNGYGSPNAKLTGRVLESAGEIVFLLLLLLLAKGYTVTRLVNRSRWFLNILKSTTSEPSWDRRAASSWPSSSAATSSCTWLSSSLNNSTLIQARQNYNFHVFIIVYNSDAAGKVLYLYESTFGYGLVILRMIGWLIFIYAVFFTLKHYPEKVNENNQKGFPLHFY